MPRICTICKHRNREPIERALLAHESYRNIAARFGTSASALVRHRREHLLSGLVKAREAEVAARADSLLGDVRNAEGRADRLYSAAEGILNRALGSSDLKTALVAIRTATAVMGEARQYLELKGELSGELSTPGQVHVDLQRTVFQVMALPRCENAPNRWPPRNGDRTLPAGELSADMMSGEFVDTQELGVENVNLGRSSENDKTAVRGNSCR
jgi:hypothetical protein